MVTLRPFFSYFGGKWRIAKRYPSPQHYLIIEPFAGSAGYSLRYPDHGIVLVESYEIVANLWKWLTKVPEKEILALPDIEDGQNVDDLDICKEANSLIGFWLNAAMTSPCKTPSKWMRDDRGGSQLHWGQRVRDRIVKQLPAIRHWSVVHANYADIEDAEATWFIDPPYEKQGKPYIHSTIDYTSLDYWCRSRLGQVIVCEHEDATWLPFQPFHIAKSAQGASRSGKSKEGIWYRESV